MKFYGKKIQLASMRGISWHVVVFIGKRGVYANSLSGPLMTHLKTQMSVSKPAMHSFHHPYPTVHWLPTEAYRPHRLIPLLPRPLG